MDYRDFMVLGVAIILGFIYYLMLNSKRAMYNKYAIVYKIFILLISFILEFTKLDYLKVGTLAFGGRPVVLYLIVFEIVDSIIDIKDIDKKEKRRKHRMRDRFKMRDNANSDAQ